MTRLHRAPDGFGLVLPNGTTVLTLAELLDALETLSQEEFSHVVTTEKHAIADWIERALQDKFLAAVVRRETTNEGIRKALFIASFR